MAVNQIKNTFLRRTVCVVAAVPIFTLAIVCHTSVAAWDAAGYAWAEMVDGMKHAWRGL